MSNSFFDWRQKPFQNRFTRFDTVRSEDANAALDEVSLGFDRALQAIQDGTGSAPQETTGSLVDGDVIQWDMAAGQMAFLTLSTQRLSRMLANPQNAKKLKYTLFVTQNPAGNQNITAYDTAYVLVGDVTINPTANSITVLQVISDGTKAYVIRLGGGVSAPAPAPTPAPSPAPSPAPAGPPITGAFAAGVNLSGMEWAAPGIRYGTSDYPNINYTVPRAATLAYLASQGITKVRLPIQWELLQPLRASSPANASVVAAYDTSLGAHVKGGLWEPYAQYIDKVLDAAQAAGIKVLLDIHNYCRYKDFKYQPDGSVLGLTDPSSPLLPPFTNDNTQVVSTIFAKASPTLTVADFTDLWTKMATRWHAHAALGGYGLMNEPNRMPALGKNFGINEYPSDYVGTPDYTEDYSILPLYLQAAIDAIRVIDGTVPIYVSGNGWSSCIGYATLNPGYPLTGNNLVYEVHVYPDATSGGFRFDYDDEVAKHFSAGEGAVDIHTTTVRTRLAQAVAWAAAHGNPILAVGEFGIPVEAKPDGTPIDTRWLDACTDALAYMKAQNMEVYTWMGGDHWSTRSFPSNHVPKLHQGKTVNPIAGALLLGALGTNNATIFDEGGQWSSGGAAVTWKVQARGNLTAPVNLTVASDNGGTFSKTALTLAAGVNSEDTFTFTPVANSVTTLSYTRTGGGQVPPARKVYSLTDPVAYAGTNLTDGANAILAKYGAACWLAKDALKEFLTPVAAAAGDVVRGISNSGSGGTIESPREMVNWLNQDAGSLRGIEAPCVLNNDSNGFAALDFRTYGLRGLIGRKLAPVVDTSSDHSKDNYRFPTTKMPFNLKDAHFMLTAFRLTTPSTDGVLLAAQSMMEASHSALFVASGTGELRSIVADKTGAASVSNIYGNIAANTVTVASMVHTGSALTGRLNGVDIGLATDTTGLAASNFDAESLGSGYWNYYPQQAIQGLVYGGIIGAGAPTAAEQDVLANYLKSFTQSAAPTLSPAESLIFARFNAPNNDGGFWGDARSLDQFWNTSADHTHPAAYGGGTAVGVWINRGNPTNGHDAVESHSLELPLLDTDADGKHYINFSTGTPILGAGGSNTAFYNILSVDDSSYGPAVLWSDYDAAAQTGSRLRYDGNGPDTYYLDIGTGGATVTMALPVTWPTGGAFRAPGKHVVEAWYDGTNMGIRIDRSASSTLSKSQAVGAAMVAGKADMMLSSDYPENTNYSGQKFYQVLFHKNYCPSLANRDTIASAFGGYATLVI